MKNLKRISLIVLVFLILFSVNVFADYEIGQDNSPEDPLYYSRKVDKNNEIAINENSKNGIMLMSVLPNKQENVDSIISKFEDGTTAVGIDVSSWQEDIDWPKVAASGVKYAILRCGYRGTSGGQIFQDKYFKKNIEGAINNGIYVGVYFFSTAINEQEAIEEANFTLEMIRGYDIKYFVAYDFELFAPDGNRTDNLPLDQVNRNALAFINTIKQNGYRGCLYGSASFFTSYWDMNQFSDCDVWTAHYYVNKPNCSRYNIWQYTDSGQVPGIKGNVDVDIDYTYFFIYNNIDMTPYMFNAVFYADSNPDLKAAFGYDELALRNHYLNSGINEGRVASPIFNPQYYMNRYPDLKTAYGNDYRTLYNHFISYGSKEGRQGSKYIDSSYYLKNNGDLIRAFYSSKTRALAHFYTNGLNEGRIGSSEFNITNYKNSVSPYYKKHLGNDNFKYIALDVGGNPVSDSNIDITPYMFDARYYADNNSDLKAAYGYDEAALRNHYEVFGKKEGRRASIIFDPQYYVRAYPDVSNAYGNDYISVYNHFAIFGALEGRSGSNELQVTKYLANYYDLQGEYGPYYTKAIEHFVLFGASEGRKGN